MKNDGQSLKYSARCRSCQGTKLTSRTHNQRNIDTFEIFSYTELKCILVRAIVNLTGILEYRPYM